MVIAICFLFFIFLGLLCSLLCVYLYLYQVISILSFLVGFHFLLIWMVRKVRRFRDNLSMPGQSSPIGTRLHEGSLCLNLGGLVPTSHFEPLLNPGSLPFLSIDDVGSSKS